MVQVNAPFIGGTCLCSCTVSMERAEAGGWEETMATPTDSVNGVVNILLTVDRENLREILKQRDALISSLYLKHRSDYGVRSEVTLGQAGTE